jgi:DNA-directed RNA polymerase subunit RPC12/RpoP
VSVDRAAERRRQSADDLFRQGRSAVKSGEMALGRRLLLQAVEQDRNHSQAWLWLSATTDELDQQRHYLEWAIAADPTNAAARRGLGIVLGKIRPEDVRPPDGQASPQPPPAPQPAVAEQTFNCPQCGGRLRYDAGQASLSCANCGYVEAVAAAPGAGSEQVLDFALPTVQAHAWAAAERLFTCQQCGATTVLPAAQTSVRCPFCDSTALVRAPEDAELLPPQAIVPMGYEHDQIYQALQSWLGRGAFMPDDLLALARKHRLHPVYVPVWSFDASLTARWRAKVREHASRDGWVERTGERTLFFTNHLQPGTRGLPADLLRAVEPFDLQRAVEFKPAYLAGWPAGTYDISLAEASLAARPAMIEHARRSLRTKAAPGQALSDLEITSSAFTGQTYKLVLLPLWLGAYQYRGKTYRVLVNGQTGKVAGDKPIDWIGVGLIALAVFIAVIPLLVLLLIARIR